MARDRTAQMREMLTFMLARVDGAPSGLPFSNFYVVENGETICWNCMTGEVTTTQVGPVIVLPASDYPLSYDQTDAD